MEEEVPLTCDSDFVVGQTQTMRFARAIGFGERSAWEIAIAASELATNALKYGGKGRLLLRGLETPRRGVEVMVEDRGPGFADLAEVEQDPEISVSLALAAGPGRPRGLRQGLGVVRRLMDDVRVENRAEGGARVTARKWMPEAKR